ncbi:DUF6918 family protein [Corynebacterium cystitidis]|uniref:Uncharacterized protein n=1 Tax=Corynebacterium cystitidis DSM 20524 TaxID=1121357 RepID=A0A1H9UJR6_9CORY|nr:hypothetical protein [Corynebacterium cystitidis]WJY80995.1 hypothetical protein CCYS_00035 [Corynebacterium cystitidis DSM 20524]SES09695.1 hypothetical protein SAMN05661109_01836 [Corynebacterium cystitidis DSM 20524]SNV90821.1 Uncharacterised protein [Corynebacterium cystitidis]
MPELSALLNEQKRPQIVAELNTVVNDTVSSTSGLTGMALKGGLGAASKMDSNFVEKGINRLLPDLLGELQPHWAKYSESGTSNFGAYLAANEDHVINGILKLADDNVSKAPAALQKVYNGLRGKAAGIISPALPKVGAAIEKHMA